jgi:hypothetical protein
MPLPIGRASPAGVILGAAGNPGRRLPLSPAHLRSVSTIWIPACGEYDATYLQRQKINRMSFLRVTMF